MRRLTPSIVLGALALILATTGGAVAAGYITGAQVKDSSLTGKDIKNRSLTPADFRGSVRGAAGPAGAPGPAGPAGPAGAAGPAGPPGPSAVNAITRVEVEATIAAGDVDSVTATCPAGQGVVSGGFRSIGADTEVFFADTFGSPNAWSVGLDNFDSSIDATVRAVAFCAPSGQAVAPAAGLRTQARNRVNDAVAAQRASHH